MNYILNGGISTKNTPIYTKDSFLISVLKEKPSGIIVDALLTRDNDLLLINESVSKLLGLSEDKIKKNDYKKIKNISYGSKVKKHNLIDLNDLIKVFNKKLFLIVNINNTKLSNEEIININNYFLKNNFDKLIVCSKSNDLLISLDSSLNKALYITKEENWDYSYKYYVSDKSNINQSIINGLERNKSIVFIYNYTNTNNINHLNNNCYIIVDNYKNIN